MVFQLLILKRLEPELEVDPSVLPLSNLPGLMVGEALICDMPPLDPTEGVRVDTELSSDGLVWVGRAIGSSEIMVEGLLEPSSSGTVDKGLEKVDVSASSATAGSDGSSTGAVEVPESSAGVDVVVVSSAMPFLSAKGFSDSCSISSYPGGRSNRFFCMMRSKPVRSFLNWKPTLMLLSGTRRSICSWTSSWRRLSLPPKLVVLMVTYCFAASSICFTDTYLPP